MVELTPDTFLNELVKLFQKTRDQGCVRVTLKRSNQQSLNTRHPNPDLEYKCLIRATDGKKKIMTMVDAKEQAKFQSSYATILRAYMDNLKKKEKSKSKATKK